MGREGKEGERGTFLGEEWGGPRVGEEAKGSESGKDATHLTLSPLFKASLPLFTPLTYATKIQGVCLRKPTRDQADCQKVSVKCFHSTLAVCHLPTHTQNAACTFLVRFHWCWWWWWEIG